MKQCEQCRYETAAFMPCNACDNGSEFAPKKIIFTTTLKEFDHKLLFMKAANALVESYKQELKLDKFLYDFGIDIANYCDPAYKFLEDFISDNYDDKHGNVLECLFAYAEYGSADLGEKEAESIEEIYDFYFGGKE